MSVYWIYMGDPAQPVLQPVVTAPVLSPKMATDCVSTGVICGKVIPPAAILLPNETKTTWNGLSSMGQQQQPQQQQQDNNNNNNRHFHIFVGDLSPELDTQQLKDAFAPFGQTSDCKIIRDQLTFKSKGYGFVSFVNKADAEKAIGCMNGQWLGSRPIRTNWAIRKPTLSNQKDGAQKAMTFEEVFSQTSPTNCTVYCGGIVSGLTEELVHLTFSSFGVIQDIRAFKEKGYAFVRFSSKESASRAIVAINGSEVNGQTVKCSWGREPNDSSAGGAPTPANPLLIPPQHPLNSALVPATNFSLAPNAFNSSTICAQLGYWNCANDYTNTLPTNNNNSSNNNNQHHHHQGFLPPSFPPQTGYTYANYCRLPTIQWSGQSCAGAPSVPGSIQVPCSQQPAILAYQTQQGYQQA